MCTQNNKAQQIYVVQLKNEISSSHFQRFNCPISSICIMGLTILLLVIRDQSELHGVFKNLRDLGLEILSLEQCGVTHL